MATAGDFFFTSQQATRKCASITYDSKFNLLVEAAGEDGLRFRQMVPTAQNDLVHNESGFQTSGQQTFGDVSRYLNVAASHMVFTPYNMMLCCHGKSMCMVRHCTGRLVHRVTLDCTEVGGIAFDSASDSFFISDSNTGAVLCMKYMEFLKSRRLDLKYNVTPAGLCIFGNNLLVPNRSPGSDSYCGLCYKMDDSHVYKIYRINIEKKIVTGKAQALNDAVSIPRLARPSSLSSVVVVPHTGSPQTRATMIGVSETDRTLYVYRVRMRKLKEGSNQMSLVFKFKAKDDKNFSDHGPNVKVPRCITTISATQVVVYFEVSAQGSKPESCGLMMYSLAPPKAAERT